MSGKHELDPALLPPLNGWQAARPPTLREYLVIRGDYGLAAAFATLFWPEFVEVEDCVLLKANLGETTFEEWQNELEGDRARIEAMINHTHTSGISFRMPRTLISPPPRSSPSLAGRSNAAGQLP